MSKAETQIVPIKISGQEFSVTCPTDKFCELTEAINYIEQKMSELTSSNKVIKIDHLIIITALNITRELIALKQKKHHKLDGLKETVQKLKSKIEELLAVPV
jgi:cell division protein ZapA (FtsZ GTPase activity inhibitor)